MAGNGVETQGPVGCYYKEDREAGFLTFPLLGGRDRCFLTPRRVPQISGLVVWEEDPSRATFNLKRTKPDSVEILPGEMGEHRLALEKPRGEWLAGSGFRLTCTTRPTGVVVLSVDAVSGDDCGFGEVRLAADLLDGFELRHLRPGGVACLPGGGWGLVPTRVNSFGVTVIPMVEQLRNRQAPADLENILPRNLPVTSGG